MERYKLAAAKRAEKLFTGDRRFDDLVQKFVKMQEMIRTPYNRFLELNGQTLAWMMAIDTCFLLDFLESYHVDGATDMVSSATNWINAMVLSLGALEQQIPDYDKVKQACMQVSSLDVAPVRFIKKNLISKPMSAASSLPGMIMRKVPLLSAMAPLLGKFMASTDVEARLKGVNLSTIINSPLAQEIMIPSVAQLAACGVRFMPAPEGMAGIGFDAATAPLTLPVLHLDSNTEVILRNLVAYETAAVRGPLVLARYTELMNGIIDTPKDVKILRECGIIFNTMKSDKEAADMWNGMCRAVRPSKVPLLDSVIRDVNAHRNRRAAVKARRFLKRYVFRSWRLLTLLAAVVLLLMTALQTFCTVYDCKRWFGGILELPQITPGGGQ
ncbi:hypothetical protein TRIUR3_27080 [Triticum urartu]|uniref:Uncharacterized protein n=1 Tax=Triticum urartu TaxID=4572 RepID=M8AIM2_TRIUA|nr:hypothetical protein TRIUR3_27080 [Triticum urartu]